MYIIIDGFLTSGKGTTVTWKFYTNRCTLEENLMMERLLTEREVAHGSTGVWVPK